VQKYLGRVSGPLLDRIDLHIEVVPVSFDKLAMLPPAEPSSVIRDRIIRAREIQLARLRDIPGIYSNSQLSPKLMRRFIRIDEPGRLLLKQAMERLGLSARAYDRILKVSLTIADLEGAPAIKPHHLAEAVKYRTLDRDMWGA
jgi:magnesium chelatase family protein